MLLVNGSSRKPVKLSLNVDNNNDLTRVTNGDCFWRTGLTEKDIVSVLQLQDYTYYNVTLIIAEAESVNSGSNKVRVCLTTPLC